jgi:multiple antibiotic resistance protein
MGFKIDELLTIVFTLFAVIDIVGSIPLLIAMKEKSGAIQSLRVTLISGVLMM